MDASLTTRTQVPCGVRIGLVVGWLIITAKCLAAPWAIAHWKIPIHPGWVIIPTVMAAVLITILVATHDWSSDED